MNGCTGVLGGLSGPSRRARSNECVVERNVPLPARADAAVRLPQSGASLLSGDR